MDKINENKSSSTINHLLSSTSYQRHTQLLQGISLVNIMKIANLSTAPKLYALEAPRSRICTKMYQGKESTK